MQLYCSLISINIMHNVIRRGWGGGYDHKTDLDSQEDDIGPVACDK